MASLATTTIAQYVFRISVHVLRQHRSHSKSRFLDIADNKMRWLWGRAVARGSVALRLHCMPLLEKMGESEA